MFDESQQNAVSNPLYEMRGKANDVEKTQASIVMEKPSFGTKFPENCHASSTYRRKAREAQREETPEELEARKKKEAREAFKQQFENGHRKVENTVKRGLGKILAAADSLTH